MSEIEFNINDAGRGSFYIETGGRKVAEMVIGINDDNMTVFHTEVSDTLKGQGIAARLLERMVVHARQEGLKVIPLCSYVRAQFEQNLEKYQDVWNQKWH